MSCLQIQNIALFLLVIFQLQYISTFGKGNILPSGTNLDLFVYISSNEAFHAFDDKKSLLWHQENISYIGSNNHDNDESHFHVSGSELNTDATETFSNTRRLSKKINITKSKYIFFNTNSSIYAHIYMCKSSMFPNPNAKSTYDEHTMYKRHELTFFKSESNAAKRKNLFENIFSSSNADKMKKNKVAMKQQKNREGGENVYNNGIMIYRYWKPSISIHLIENIPPFSRKDMPVHLRKLGIFFHRNGKFYPPIYINEFWLMFNTFILLNDNSISHSNSNKLSLKKENDLFEDEIKLNFIGNKKENAIPLTMKYETMDYYNWYFQAHMENSWEIQRQLGTQKMYDQDETKRIFLETNPKLLFITLIVSVLHTIFDFLAFKNDIVFWKNTKSMVGLSVKSIILNCIFQLIILLYLLDNETATIILFSNSIALSIECWKLTKLFHIKLIALFRICAGFTFYIPVFRSSYHNNENYIKSNTKRYESIAIRHLSTFIYPLLLGYALYSFIYLKHKNVYSWIINAMVGFIYAFGFILMTPQLFINYKLKSVAHLPWRKMFYKFLNTFIDDLFAFIIKMPTLHRIACLRDDIVFFIFIYQSCIYDIDNTRLNEYEQKEK